MARKTPQEKLPRLVIQYYERYVRFSEQLHNTWLYFEIQPEIFKIVEQECKNEEYKDQIRVVSKSPINSGNRAPIRLRGTNLAGFIARTHRKEIPETVLLNGVSLFEAFISDIAQIAYLEFPKRFLLRETKNVAGDIASDQENTKLLKLLIESSSKEEAIERYIEEKLRGIFYGSPVDIFTKNKLGFGLDKTMGKDCLDIIGMYAEIAARRNVIVHNLGRVDSKYIREVRETNMKMGDIVRIDRDYLFQALHTINSLAKRYVTEVALCTTSKGLPSVRMGA